MLDTLGSRPGFDKDPHSTEQFAILFSYRMLLTFQWGMVYSPCKKEAKDASILCEMPSQKGNEGCQEHNYEEWQTGNSRHMSHMRNENVQNRKKLRGDQTRSLPTTEGARLNPVPLLVFVIAHCKLSCNAQHVAQAQKSNYWLIGGSYPI